MSEKEAISVLLKYDKCRKIYDCSQNCAVCPYVITFGDLNDAIETVIPILQNMNRKE